MRKRLVMSLIVTFLIAACAAPAAPAPTAAPARPTTAPSAMANKLIVYDDTVLFSTQDNPDNCVLKSRYKKGDGVGFRMTAVDPQTGKVVEDADIVVKVGNETVAMRYRGTGTNPHPGMWTGRWNVPATQPTGIVKYTVEAKDKSGRTGTYEPFNVEASMLTITN